MKQLYNGFYIDQSEYASDDLLTGKWWARYERGGYICRDGYVRSEALRLNHQLNEFQPPIDEQLSKLYCGYFNSEAEVRTAIDKFNAREEYIKSFSITSMFHIGGKQRWYISRGNESYARYLGHDLQFRGSAITKYDYDGPDSAWYNSKEEAELYIRLHVKRKEF